MKELYELRDKLCDELKEYGKRDMSSGALDVIDKLAHAIKNIDKVIDVSETEYSYGRRRDSMGRYANNYSYRDDMRYEEGGMPHDKRRGFA